MKNILTISLIIFSALSAWAQEEILANFSPEEIRPHSATRYVITLKNIKAEINNNSNYRTAAKPYLDSIRILSQAESYRNLAEIETLYNKTMQ